MNTDKRKKGIHRWVRFMWISAVAGSIPAVMGALFGSAGWRGSVRQAGYGFIYAACIGALCTVVLPRIAKRVLRLRPATRWLTLVSIISGLAAVGCFAATLIIVLAGALPASYFWLEYFASLKVSVLIALAFALSAFFHEVIMARLNRTTNELKARDEAAEKLRQAATEARLSSLESRVQPHFLFNTLNSVLALIREDPESAERMVERLAALLRFSLDANQSRLVPLSLEAKIIRDYLEIERARFGQRLRFLIEIPRALESLPVPPMSLQTVVENSVKYAVSSRREGANITLRASHADGVARIEVADDGPGFATTQLTPGHGLELLHDRIAGLYEGRASLEIATLATGGASVTLTVPAAVTVPEHPREFAEAAK